MQSNADDMPFLDLCLKEFHNNIRDKLVSKDENSSSAEEKANKEFLTKIANDNMFLDFILRHRKGKAVLSIINEGLVNGFKSHCLRQT